MSDNKKKIKIAVKASASKASQATKATKATKASKAQASKASRAPWCIEDLNVGHFDQIYHISDIHIRPLQRHVEFSEVFAGVETALKQLKPGTITVITGDVFDNKTVFRPETFKICRDLFKMITKYTPLVLIAGNHDMMENNTNRLDAITPVVDDIPNLHYLKNSGLYFCPDRQICFVVSSLYDKEFLRYEDVSKSASYREDYQYIALYHGALTGAQTDTGYMVGGDLDLDLEAGPEESTRYRSINDFVGYRAVLLGDIHKHQVWANKNIAYAGSLIQQNHGESLDGHGILVWDVNTWQSKLLEINNNYGFVDIICHDGEWINQDLQLPKNCYARLVIKNCTETQIDILVATLKGRVESLTITKRQCISDNIDEFEIPPDIKRKDDELSLIREQADNNGYDADKLIELHKSYQIELDVEAQGMSTAVWRPVLLEFKNMFGYGNNILNKMYFKQGITSISAGNTHGKTSLVNIILFAIFGRTPLNPSSTTYTFDIINNMQETGYVKILLNHGGQYYLIERATVRKNTKTVASAILQKLNRYDFSCVIWESNIKGEKLKNRSEIRKNNNDTCIKELFGDINDFSLSNLLNKESSLDLLCMTPAEQVKTLKKLFKLEIYDSYKEFNKSKLLEIEKTISETRIKRQTLDSLVDSTITQTYLDGIQEELNTKTVLRDEMMETLRLLQADKHEYESMINRIDADVRQVDTTDLPSKEERQDVLNELARLTPAPLSTGTRSETLEYILKDQQQRITELSRHLDSCSGSDLVPSQEELSKKLHDLTKRLSEMEAQGLRNGSSVGILNRDCGKISTYIESLELQIKSASAGASAGAQADTELAAETLTIAELQARLVPLSSNLTAIQSRLDVLSELLTDEPVDLNVSHKSIIERHRLEVSRLKAENTMLSMTRNTMYDGTDTIQDLTKSLKTGIPGIKYSVPCNALANAMQAKSDIMKMLSELACEHTVQEIVDSLYLLPYGTDQWIISNDLANDITTQLENGDTLKKLESDLHRATWEVKQIEDKLQCNIDIQNNIEIQSDIAQLRWSLNNQSLSDIEHLIHEQEILQDQCTYTLEYQALCQEEEQHYDNQDLVARIDRLKDADKLENLRHELLVQKDLLHEKEQALEYLVIKQDILDVETGLQTYNEILQLDKLKVDKEHTVDKLEVQNVYERYEYLLDIRDRLLIVDNNQKLRASRIGLEQDLIDINNDIAAQSEELDICTRELHQVQEQLSVMTYRFNEQAQIHRKLSETETRLIELETEIIPYQDYSAIMGTKGITSKLLFNKIKSIEDYINTIIRTFTKYVIHILYDDKKQSISIVTENKETRNYLSTSRLSGYEKLMLQIAFKRALNKFSYNSKSSLIIIDEALDCIDQDNFVTKLPDVMNLVTQDYSNCLTISQRDISHISDNIVTIKRHDGSSSLLG